MKPILYALDGNESFAHGLAHTLGCDEGKAPSRRFPDGETHVQFQENIGGRPVIFVASLDHPNDKLVSLYLLSKTARDLGASQVGLVAPYLAYMRQDKVFHDGEGITSLYMAQWISGFCDWIVTVDPHLHRHDSLGEIYSIPAISVHASPLIAEWTTHHVTNPLFVGPDAESKQWVADVAQRAQAPFVVLEKIRNGDRDVEVTVPHIDKWKQHIPVLVDDIISTGRTMCETVGHLKRAGMKSPVCIGVHGLFAQDAYEQLTTAGADQIVTTNTIVHPSNAIDVTAPVAIAIGQQLKNKPPH